MPTTFDKLSKRIEKDLEIKTGKFRRCRPGYWQRSAGAWSWVCNEINEDGTLITSFDIGSSYSATDLLAHKGKLIIYNREILPDN